MNMNIELVDEAPLADEATELGVELYKEAVAHAAKFAKGQPVTIMTAYLMYTLYAMCKLHAMHSAGCDHIKCHAEVMDFLLRCFKKRADFEYCPVREGDPSSPWKVKQDDR